MIILTFISSKLWTGLLLHNYCCTQGQFPGHSILHVNISAPCKRCRVSVASTVQLHLLPVAVLNNGGVILLLGELSELTSPHLTFGQKYNPWPLYAINALIFISVSVSFYCIVWAEADPLNVHFLSSFSWCVCFLCVKCNVFIQLKKLDCALLT